MSDGIRRKIARTSAGLAALLTATVAGSALLGLCLEIYFRVTHSAVNFVLLRGTSHLMDYVRAHPERVTTLHAVGSLAGCALSLITTCWITYLIRVLKPDRLPARALLAVSSMLTLVLGIQVATGATADWKALYVEGAPSSLSAWHSGVGVVLTSGGLIALILLLDAVLRPMSPAPPPQFFRPGPTLRPLFGLCLAAGMLVNVIELVICFLTRDLGFTSSSRIFLLILTSVGVGCWSGLMIFAVLAVLQFFHTASVGLIFRRRAWAHVTTLFGLAALFVFLSQTVFRPEQHLLRTLQLEDGAMTVLLGGVVLLSYPLLDTLSRAVREAEAEGSPPLEAAARTLIELPAWPILAALRGFGMKRTPFPLIVGLGVVEIGILFHFTLFEFNDYARFFHVPLTKWLLLFTLALLGVLYRRVPWRLPRPAAGAAFGALLLGISPSALFILESSEEIRFLAFRKTDALRSQIYTLRVLTDVDGDGFSGLLGGGDPEAFNANVHPHAGSQAPDPPLLFPQESRTPGPPAKGPRPNVVVITIDALRADALEARGYPRPITPTLDAISRDGLYFDRAVAPGAASYVSLMALFSGRYRSRYLMEDVSRERFLAEMLSEAGYEVLISSRTEAQAFRATAPLISLNEDSRGPNARADVITDRIIERLRARSDPRPFLLWAHYYEPHEPYWQQPGTPVYGPTHRDRYDSEVQFADRHVGRLLRFLGDQKFLDRTLLIITGDHGEEFMEHGLRYHSINLYDETIRVPLLVRGPGIPPARISDPVSLVDIVPTIMDVLELDPRTPLHGVSLLRLTAKPRPTRTHLFSVSGWGDKFCVLEGDRWKLIYGRTHNISELYDLSADPGERINLIDVREEKARELRAVLGGLIREIEGGFVDRGPLDRAPLPHRKR